MRDRMSLRVGASALYTWLRGPTWDAGSVLVGPSAELGVIWARARLGAYVDVTDGRYRLAPNVGFAIGW
jgi:hypothetical protein